MPRANPPPSANPMRTGGTCDERPLLPAAGSVNCRNPPTKPTRRAPSNIQPWSMASPRNLKRFLLRGASRRRSCLCQKGLIPTLNRWDEPVRPLSRQARNIASRAGISTSLLQWRKTGKRVTFRDYRMLKRLILKAPPNLSPKVSRSLRELSKAWSMRPTPMEHKQKRRHAALLR